MAFKLGVLVVHGIGAQEADFAEGMKKELRKRLGPEAESVCFKPVWWAPVLADAENALYDKMTSADSLDYLKLRRFVIHFLGDAVAYQRVPHGAFHSDVYEAIHAKVAQSLHELRNEVRLGVPAETPEVPLLVLAHSLGGHILSNHIWDLQRPENPRQPVGDNAFEKAQTLAGMVTFGCNIPLFTLAYNKLIPIKVPSPTLAQYFPAGTSPAQLKAAAKWLNFYDPDDILGYPLASLSKPYGEIVKDVAVNAGGLATSWNPLSHNEYWTDGDVTKPIAELIRGLLALLG